MKATKILAASLVAALMLPTVFRGQDKPQPKLSVPLKVDVVFTEYEDEKKYPRNAPKPYAGRGWVAANKVGASYANGGTRMGGLFQAPFTDAKWTQAARKLGGPLDTDGGPKRLLACSGYWGLVESEDGVRGWWRGLCSNQVTNCS